MFGFFLSSYKRTTGYCRSRMYSTLKWGVFASFGEWRFNFRCLVKTTFGRYLTQLHWQDAFEEVKRLYWCNRELRMELKGHWSSRFTTSPSRPLFLLSGYWLLKRQKCWPSMSCGVAAEIENEGSKRMRLRLGRCREKRDRLTTIRTAHVRKKLSIMERKSILKSIWSWTSRINRRITTVF